MSHHPSSPPAAAPAAKSGNMIRLAILIGLLAIAIGMWWYDYSYAFPRSVKGYDDIQKLVDDRNQKGVTEGDHVRAKDVQELLKFGPTYTKTEKDYTVEYYCWWGPIPGLNTWKRYVTVVYVGPEPRRYGTHHLNEPPPEELLPGYVAVSTETPAGQGAAPEGAAPGGMGPPGMGPPGMGPPGMGGKKGKGGRGRGSAPAEGDAPATEPATEVKPATEGDKPATEGDKPATEGDKPGDAPKAGDKPAETPTEGDAKKPADE